MCNSVTVFSKRSNSTDAMETWVIENGRSLFAGSTPSQVSLLGIAKPELVVEEVNHSKAEIEYKPCPKGIF
jgi:hypothetical protein